MEELGTSLIGTPDSALADPEDCFGSFSMPTAMEEVVAERPPDALVAQRVPSRSGLTLSMEEYGLSINDSAGEREASHGVPLSLSSSQAQLQTDGDDDQVRCANCKLAPDTEVLICGGCKNEHYCSRLCQEEHWPEHRASCSSDHVHKEAYYGNTYPLPLAREVCFDVSGVLCLINCAVLVLVCYALSQSPTSAQTVAYVVIGVLAIVNTLAMVIIGLILLPNVAVKCVEVREEGLLVPGSSLLKVRGSLVPYTDICRVELVHAGRWTFAGLSDNIALQTRSGDTFFMPHHLQGKSELLFFLRSFFPHIFMDPGLLEEVHLTSASPLH